MTTLQMSVCKAQYDIFIILRAGYPITMETFYNEASKQCEYELDKCSEGAFCSRFLPHVRGTWQKDLLSLFPIKM